MKTRKKKIVNSVKMLIGIIITIIVIGPLLVTIFASLKTANDMVLTNPLWLPPLAQITLDNFKEVLQNKLLPYAIKNTLIIVTISLIFNITIGSITAFVLERFDFPFRKLIFSMFFVSMMVPTAITEIARFKVIQSLGLYNSLGAPIIIYIASDLTQLYLYRQFISKIPISLDESAIIDGCSYMGLYWKIIFPLLKPATATLVIIKSIYIINDMYVPYLYMPSNEMKTMTTFLMAYASADSGSWQKLSAAVVIVLLPTIILYVFFQNSIIEGVTAGAVKE